MAIAEKDVLGDIQQEAEPVEAAAPATLPLEKGKRGQKKQPQAAADPASVPAPVATAPAKARRTFKIPVFVPWLLLAVALMVGGFWLVLNPWAITNNINQPYALLAGPALAVSVLTFWLIIKFFTAIERGIKASIVAFKAARAKDEGSQFFWMVIAVFLVVSVFASGDFFAKLEKEAIPGLGYATAFVIDLVAVICMRARLNAGRMRDKAGQTLYLVGVLVCASASAFANLYTTLTTFNTATTGSLPGWMAAIAPWFGVVFPALIVLLSLTADYTLDQTSSKLDPEAYRVQESKRVKMREYQRDLLRDRVEIEQDIDDLSARLLGRKERRTFFLIAWLFPIQMSGKQLLKRVEELYQPQIAGLVQQNEALLQQNEALRGSLATVELNAQGAYGSLFQAFQVVQASVDGQRDTDNRLISERIESLAVGLRQELAAAALVEDLRQEMRFLAPVAQIEELAGVLRQEMSVLAPASWVEEMGQKVSTLAPAAQVDRLTSQLRQEMRSLTPAKMRVNYPELARALAPLLVKQNGLHEVNSVVDGEVTGESSERVAGDTEELSAIDLEALASANGSEEAELQEDEVELQEDEREVLLQQATVSVKDAARLIGCEAKYVRTLRDRRKLKASPRNNNLITTDSIKAYLLERSVKVS